MKRTRADPIERLELPVASHGTRRQIIQRDPACRLPVAWRGRAIAISPWSTCRA